VASALTRLHRVAYGQAMALARLAERAYQYERGDNTSVLAASYWDASLGGFMAGERLLSDLQAIDRRFLETNHRELEIDQPIPLSQIDAPALVRLRELGDCHFTIPEAAFDLAYPGHWRRRLRAVRLTIPCVTGPYVNVSATFSLESSKVRTTPNGGLTEVPLAHTTTIAASGAQADGGVFELSFRDERYLPFEGQGAVSSWHLELPSVVRSFDYSSITDVIVSLAYSARRDNARRDTVEGAITAAGSLLKYFHDTPNVRIVSARQELGAAFMRLLRSEATTAVAFDLSADLLPPVYRGRTTTVLDADPVADPPLLAGVALKLAKGATLGNFKLKVDNALADDFDPQDLLGNLPYAPLTWSPAMTWPGSHTFTVTDVGDVGTAGVLDPDQLLDILLVIPVQLAGA
jgi:hypothetical protein